MTEDSTDRSARPAGRGWARRLAGYCWRYKRAVVLALGASLGGMAIMALVPLLTKIIIDDVVVGGKGSIWTWIGLLVAAAAVVYVLTYARRYYGGRLALDVQHDLRTEMYRSIVRLDGRSQDELSTGQVVGRGTSDLQLVQSLLFMLPMMIGNVLLFLVALVVMVVLSPLLTLVSLAVFPLLWWVADRSRKRLFPRHLVRAAAGRRGRLRGGRLRHRRTGGQGVRPGGAGDRQTAAGRPQTCSRAGCAPCASTPATPPPSRRCRPSARSRCWRSAAGWPPAARSPSAPSSPSPPTWPSWWARCGCWR
ncbi:hypothetical protein TPA0909_05090 [Streptomyces albus]|nr:hypothetical protein TPA0909_05090 [Streptomyces albus]